MSFSALSFVRNASDLSSLGFQWRGRKGYRSLRRRYCAQDDRKNQPALRKVRLMRYSPSER